MAVHASTVQRVVDNLERSSHGIFVTPAAEDIDPISVWLDIVRRVPLGRRHVLYVYDFGSWPSSFWPQSEAQGYGTDPACVIHGYSSKNGFNRARAWRSFGECMAKEGSEECGHEVDAEHEMHFMYEAEEHEGSDDMEGHWDVHGHVSCREFQ